MGHVGGYQKKPKIYKIRREIYVANFIPTANGASIRVSLDLKTRSVHSRFNIFNSRLTLH